MDRVKIEYFTIYKSSACSLFQDMLPGVGLSILYFSISALAIRPNSYPSPSLSNCSRVNLVELIAPYSIPLTRAVETPRACRGHVKTDLNLSALWIHCT